MSTNILVTLGLSGAKKDKREQKTQEEKISNWYWVDSKKVEKRNIYRNENGEGKGGKEGQPALVKNDRQSPEQTSEWDAVGQQQPRDQGRNQRDLFSSSSLGFWKWSWRKVRRKKEKPAKECKPDETSRSLARQSLSGWDDSMFRLEKHGTSLWICGYRV